MKVQELGLGKGKEAHADSRVEVDFVLRQACSWQQLAMSQIQEAATPAFACRRPNGYFIYSTVQGVSFQPKDVPIGPLDLNLVSASKTVLLVQTGWVQVTEEKLCPARSQFHKLCFWALHVIVQRWFPCWWVAAFSTKMCPQRVFNCGLSGRAWTAQPTSTLGGKAPHAGQRSPRGKCAGHPLQESIPGYLCWMQ